MLLSTRGLNCENFDGVQTNKYLSQFSKWLVSMFSVMDYLTWEYTDALNIVRVSKLLQTFLFKLRVTYVCRMNTQVRFLNSLVRLVGWVNSELVGSMRNTERMMFNSMHNVEMPSIKMSYLLSFPLLARIARQVCFAGCRLQVAGWNLIITGKPLALRIKGLL